MKKKIILILSIVAVVTCLFAMSVSASNYVDFDSVDLINMDCSPMLQVYSSKKCDYCGFVSSHDEEFGLVYISADGSYSCGFLNIEFWHSLLTEHGVDSVDEFGELSYELVDDERICECSSGLSYQIGSECLSYFIVYEKYLAELNAPTYEEGKIDGVTEYKTSNEYTNTLNEKYVEGKADGMLEYKASSEYFNELNQKYTEGKTEGVTVYKNSTEYKNTLSAKYSTGFADGKANYVESEEYTEAMQLKYDEGFEAGTNEAQTDKLGTTLLSIVGSSLLGLGIVWVVKRFTSKNKRRRYS